MFVWAFNCGSQCWCCLLGCSIALRCSVQVFSMNGLQLYFQRLEDVELWQVSPFQDCYCCFGSRDDEAEAFWKRYRIGEDPDIWHNAVPTGPTSRDVFVLLKYQVPYYIRKRAGSKRKVLFYTFFILKKVPFCWGDVFWENPLDLMTNQLRRWLEEVQVWEVRGCWGPENEKTCVLLSCLPRRNLEIFKKCSYYFLVLSARMVDCWNFLDTASKSYGNYGSR